MIKISVTVKPNAAETQIEQTGAKEYTARIHAPAHDGKANTALIAALAQHFCLPKSRIKILHGLSSRKKVVDVQNTP